VSSSFLPLPLLLLFSRNTGSKSEKTKLTPPPCDMISEKEEKKKKKK
jgi:hypothetical protein